jgi:selenocysteine lyase/cysteine desulfurase
MADSYDVQAVRAEFPITNEWTYINHATWGPYPARTVEAIKAYADGWANPPTYNSTHDNQRVVNELRQRIAGLVNGKPEMVAFTASLAEGMNIMLNGIEWIAGDNVIVPVEEFPSVAFPALNLERKGVEVRWAAKSSELRTDLSKIEALMDARTRAVAISHVEWADGFRNDLQALGALCRGRDIELFVDVTQSLGAQPIDVTNWGVSGVAAHGYKWLLSSFGTGVMVFNEDAFQRITPTYAGRMSVKNEGKLTLDWKDTAERFQTGGFNMPTITAMHASLSLVSEVGPERSAAHTATLVDRLAEGLTQMGYEIVSDLSPEHRSQIISLTSGDLERDKRLVAELEERKVSVVMRARGVRISPYFYNTEVDIDRLLEALPPR